LSSSAKADDPVFQSACDRIEKLRRTGYPAFAGYDGGKLRMTAAQDPVLNFVYGAFRDGIAFNGGWSHC
jgi:hypothetical protein